MPDDVNIASRRRAGVQATEERLLTAAHELFLAHGYQATTLASVAERAGLAPRTVYVRFATKADLFSRVVGVALVGDTDQVDVAHRARSLDTLTHPTLAGRIQALVDVSAGIVDRAGSLFVVADGAEGVEPAVAAAAQAGREETRELCLGMWRKAADDGLLPDGADTQWLGETTDVVLCADNWVHLARTGSWPLAKYRAWLSRTLSALAAASVVP